MKLQVFQGNPNFGQIVCLDPVINLPSTNYIFESTMNELIVNYEFIRGNPVGFRIKFTSDKMSSKLYIIIYICTYFIIK